MLPILPPRKLPYSLQSSSQITAITDGSDIPHEIPDFFPIDPDEKKIIGLNLSLNDYVKLASAIDVGRDIAYPDYSVNLWETWVKALIEFEATLTEEGDCLAYPLWSPFISYQPFSPYNEDEIPDGYDSNPFIIHDGGGSLPPAYIDGDLIIPLTSLSPIDYTIFGNPITIRIDVIGSGQVEIDLLQIPLGGVAVLKVGDNPPNALDIVAGIVSADINIIDLNLDVLSIPPETDIVTAQEINIDAAVGVQSTIWIQFLPIVDDSVIPLRFGGGLRSVQLCGFEQDAMVMGVVDVRQVGDKLEKFINGAWVEFADMLSEAEIEPIIAASPTIANLNQAIIDNEADIAFESDRIDTNIIAIGDNTVDIQDHETRIVALENAPAGDVELTTATQKAIIRRQIHSDLILSDFTTWHVDIPQTHNHIVLRINATNAGGSKTYLAMYKNEDFTNANYQQYRSTGSAGNAPYISWLAGSSGGGNIEQFIEIEIVGVLQSNKQMGVVRAGIAADAAAISGDAYFGAWFCENAGAITRLSFRSSASQDIQAGSSVQVFGIEEIDVVTSVEVDQPAPQVPVSWDATLYFTEIGSLPAFVGLDNFVYDAVNDIVDSVASANFTGYIDIDGGALSKWDTVSLDWFYTGDEFQADLWAGDFDDLLDASIGTANQFDQEYTFTERNEQTLRLTFNHYSNPANTVWNIRKIVIKGQGAIPPNLTAYGQEYF